MLEKYANMLNGFPKVLSKSKEQLSKFRNQNNNNKCKINRTTQASGTQWSTTSLPACLLNKGKLNST